MTTVPYSTVAAATAEIVLQRCDQLAACTSEPGVITRAAYTPAMHVAQRLVATWMQTAGMQTHTDAVGNLIGRYPSDHPGAPILLLGSHLDTVRNAGKYDGMLGVLLAIAAVERCQQENISLPYTIEVIAFADEEGLRFHTAYLGSRALAGTFNPAWLALRDDQNVTMADAITTYGGDPDAIPRLRRERAPLLGFCEIHIEQGPVLQHHDVPVGIVTAIAGQTRARLTFRGQAGHAGTVPMPMRHDALCGAAAFVLAVEEHAHTTPDLKATVGQCTAYPGVGNVIAAEAVVSLDVRHANNDARYAAVAAIRAAAERIAAERGLTVGWEDLDDSTATPCSPQLRAWWADAVAATGLPVRELASGAGHDAVAMADLTPVGMLFVRCKDGISHHPDEHVTHADVACASDTIHHFLNIVAQQTTAPLDG